MSAVAYSNPTQWREKARETREATAKPLPLPSGAVVLAARPPIEVWISSGKYPQTLTEDVDRVFNQTKGDPEEIDAAFKEIGEERSGTLLVFMRDAVAAAVVRPKIVSTVQGVEKHYGARIDGVPTGETDASGLPVVRTLQADEMAASEIPLEDFSFIFGWVLQGSPDIPVETLRGEVSVESLRNFRKKPRKQSSSARKNSRKVRQDAERVHGDS
jgi:hypothetical protein